MNQPRAQVCDTLARTLVAGLFAAIGSVSAAPTYTSTAVYVPPDQFEQGRKEQGLAPRPIYKPHDGRTALASNAWITSNERTGCAGITTLSDTGNTLKNVIIDEPDVQYQGGGEAGLTLCVGSLVPEPAVEPPEPPEGTPPAPEEQFPPEQRFAPSVCLPVVLPPGQAFVKYDVEVVGGGRAQGTVASPGPGLVCAPLGAERHARHPHGIAIDSKRQIAYQVIEHSGLRWNGDRSRFQVAETTDEESGMTLAWDVKDPGNPRILKAYLNGHGAHEVAVNEANGLVFQGNHEDSPGVWPNIWVDVIDTTKSNPYGFIDTGYFNAILGIDVDEAKNLVYGVAHVGEKVFAFDANCTPQRNPRGVVPPPAPAGYSLPPGDTGMQTGWNCIKWWVDLRPAFLQKFPELAGLLAPTAQTRNVLHMHNLVADDSGHRSYSTVHSIHDAEHTGLPGDEPPPGEETGDEVDAGHHFMARYVIEVNQPADVDATTRQASAPVYIIDLSHGYDLSAFPNAESVQGGLSSLQRSFVHAHFIAVDPARNALLVTGEHTGNLAVVDVRTRALEQVIPITRQVRGCTPPPPEPGQAKEAEEPHVHGVTVQQPTGKLYVFDEGEHCFYESATVLEPGGK